jgi:3-hydroxybutyryl-CoA dehydratase
MSESIEPKCLYEAGEIFLKDMCFTKAATRAFSEFIGDSNPLHLDEDYAKKSRFGGIIVAGAHTAGAMAAFTATFTTARTINNVGLEINFRFRRAVMAEEKLRCEWKVAAIENKPSMKGHIVTFDGTLYNEAGEAAVIGQTRTLVFYEQPAT